MEIRKLTENDLEALAGLYKTFWGEDSDLTKMKTKFIELKDDPKYIFLCATIDNVLVGTIMGIVCDELYGDCRPFLVMEDLVVDTNYRQQGIGKALMNEIENIAMEKDCYQIHFITDASRKDAISFYESLGYSSSTHIGFKKSLR